MVSEASGHSHSANRALPDRDTLLEQLPAPSYGRVRYVARLRPPYQHLGLKWFRPRRGRRSAARNEFAKAQQLKQLDVPCPQVRKLIPDSEHGDFIIMDWIDAAMPLDQAVLERKLSASDQRQIAADAGRLIRSLHAAGLAHRDLHAGNLLWQPHQQRLWLIDFHRLRRATRKLKQRDVLDLSHFFLHRVSSKHLLRFLAHYLPDWRTKTPTQRRDIWRQWQQRSQASLYQFLRHHEQRCLGRGRAFRRWQHVGLHGVARDDLPEPELLEILQMLATESDAQPWLHRSSRTALRIVQCRGRALVIKQYLPGSRRKALLQRWLPSRGRRAWRYAYRLAMAQITTPKPLLYGEGRLEGSMGERASWSMKRSPTRSTLVIICAKCRPNNHSRFCNDSRASSPCCTTSSCVIAT